MAYVKFYLCLLLVYGYFSSQRITGTAVVTSGDVNCTFSQTPCATGFFLCYNGRCVPGMSVCDRKLNCGDGSDEVNCEFILSSSGVLRNKFICSNNVRIENYAVCDGFDNCGDNSDEAKCGTYYSEECGPDNWQCNNGYCVNSTALCNGVNDCGDNSDEMCCANYLPTTPALPPLIIAGTCQSTSDFLCDNDFCVSQSTVCDGHTDCQDLSDESNDTCLICSDPMRPFHCDNNKCLKTNLLCDGKDDCGDNSDESVALCQQCSLSSEMFRCKTSQKCVHLGRVCSKTSVCGFEDQTDNMPEACEAKIETILSEAKPCPMGSVQCSTSPSICVEQSRLCDGVPDCCLDQAGFGGLPQNDTHIGDCERTDEIGCQLGTLCSKSNGNCADKCITVRRARIPHQVSYCSCSPGFYRPSSSLSSCADYDECQFILANNCSQQCINLPGSFNCTCRDGFVDKGLANGQDASGRCVPANTTIFPEQPVILFVHGDTIRILQLDQLKATLLVQPMKSDASTVFDIDVRDGTVVYSENSGTSLSRTALPIDNQQPPSAPFINTVPLMNIVAVSIDFIGNNLYIANYDNQRNYSRVVVSVADGRYQRVLKETALRITSLTTNPLTGALFYATVNESDYNSTRCAIFMSPMNEQEINEQFSIQIYSSVQRCSIKNCNCSIQSLSVDYLANGRLYFFDGIKMAVMENDGSKFTFLNIPQDYLLATMDVFGNYLYGATIGGKLKEDGQLYEINLVDKFGRLGFNVTDLMTNVGSVRVFHPLKAGIQTSWPNPCRSMKCSHLCLIGFHGVATCGCPDSEDRENCNSEKIPEPEHPASCLRFCKKGQGLCGIDPDTGSHICICKPSFTGKYCTISLITTTPIPVNHLGITTSASVVTGCTRNSEVPWSWTTSPALPTGIAPATSPPKGYARISGFTVGLLSENIDDGTTHRKIFRHFSRSLNAQGTPETFFYGKPIMFPESTENLLSKMTFAFGVKNGYNPSRTDANVSIHVPEFEDVNGTFSFVKYESTWMISTTRERWRSFTLDLKTLTEAKVCEIEGRSMATVKDSPYEDVTMFHVDFYYPLTISSITVDRSSGCSCLFTCNLAACPSQTFGVVEWAFFDTFSYDERLLTYNPSNVDSSSNQYLLNYESCQGLFKVANRLRRSYFVRCRTRPTNASSLISKETLLYDLLRPCSANEFQCNSSRECVSQDRRCDGRNDCLDRSDEKNCPPTNLGKCPDDRFLCQSSKECIPMYKRCDFAVDCSDGSDERDCIPIRTPCAIGFFVCENGRCAQGFTVCDGSDHCGDGSDEENCGGHSSRASCKKEEFVCANKNCVSNFVVCDGKDDCGDKTDERNCGTYVAANCGSAYWQCSGGQCVLSDYLCDGFNDCKDGGDEAVCGGISLKELEASLLVVGQPANASGLALTSCEFLCKNGKCVAMSHVCDGYDDCSDNSDEGNATCSRCPILSRSFHCGNDVCISSEFLCNGHDDCGDGSDESICQDCSLARGLWQCIGSQKCLPISQVCAGNGACGSGDESDMLPQACEEKLQNVRSQPVRCPPRSVKCTTSPTICVEENKLCDGVIDCCPEEVASAAFFYPENGTHIGNCEKTDEIGCSPMASCAKANGYCADRCISTTFPMQTNLCANSMSFKAAYCACKPGYHRPWHNLSTCIDFDECRSIFANNCTQICVNTPGSFACSCASGFVEKGERGSGICVASDSTADPTVLFVRDDVIRMWQKSWQDSEILVEAPNSPSITAFDIDIRDGTVIFAESTNIFLVRTSLPINNLHVPTLPLPNSIPFMNVVDISVDFIGNNLYVADFNDITVRSRVIVSLVDGRYQRILKDTSLRITSMTTNPLLGLLYYSTINGTEVDRRCSIIMAAMNFGDSSEIYSSSNRRCYIQSLTVDYLANGRIYYFDGTTIAVSNFDGSSNVTFKQLLGMKSTDRGFDVFGSLIYGLFATDYGQGDDFGLRKLYEIEKFGRLAISFSELIDNVANLRVFHALKAGLNSTWPNPCKSMNCSHLCLLDANRKATCACPNSLDQQRCNSDTIPEPEHPANCLRKCVKGQGYCALDPDTRGHICICKPMFTGKYCSTAIDSSRFIPRRPNNEI